MYHYDSNSGGRCGSDRIDNDGRSDRSVARSHCTVARSDRNDWIVDRSDRLGCYLDLGGGKRRVKHTPTIGSR